MARECIQERPLLKYAIKKDIPMSIKFLKQEEMCERKKDIKYWQPLKQELEMLRHRQKLHLRSGKSKKH
ncbi:MAG: hypothetical protein ABIJ11_08235 [Elusimicrobiota bacterium]